MAGAKEAKEELEEVVDFLKRPAKFSAMGAKILIPGIHTRALGCWMGLWMEDSARTM